jgi:hypothetical protein
MGRSKPFVRSKAAWYFNEAVNAWDTLIVIYGYDSRQLEAINMRMLRDGKADLERWLYFIDLLKECKKTTQKTPRDPYNVLDYYTEFQVTNTIQVNTYWRQFTTKRNSKGRERMRVLIS